MSLKNASFLAFVGTALVTLLLVWDLISNILNVARGLIAATMLLSNLIYAVRRVDRRVVFLRVPERQTLTPDSDPSLTVGAPKTHPNVS